MGEKLTINTAMVLMKAVRERLNELKSLRSEVSAKKTTSWIYETSGKDKTESIEPQFDVKKVDKKITELELFLFKADSEVKQANAFTEIDLKADVDTLLAPLE